MSRDQPLSRRRGRQQRLPCALVLALASAFLVRCGPRAGKDERASVAASSSARQVPPRTRAEAVAHADVLAVDAERRGGSEGAALRVKAAEERLRAFRVEGVTADALEAADLYRRAAAQDFPGACDAEVELALLEGELKADPGAEYGVLYVARARHRGAPCVARIDGVLSTLAAFAPPRDVLADLERRSGSATGGKPAPSATPAPSGGVVVPQIQAEASREPALITSVEHYGGKDAARVVVHVTRPTLFSVGELPADGVHGPRVFVDIEHAKPKGHRSIDGDGLVERVRVGEQGAMTRIALDLSAPVSRHVFYLPEPFRLVIDVLREAAATPAAEAGPRRVRRVVLDPGHGGHDPGALGAAGLREKDVVLDIAHRAAPLLARELGISTLLTRDADVFVPLDERVARANAFSSDLFVSIHCNASESAGSRGVMTFVLDASRDDLAARVAARENAASAEASVEVANAMSHVLDRASLLRSNHLADLLQRASVASLSPHYSDVLDQGVKSAGFYVLAGARMPAVLFETSFISNPAEERRLDTADYRQKMADAIVNAVRAFRDGL